MKNRLVALSTSLKEKSQLTISSAEKINNVINTKVNYLFFNCFFCTFYFT